MLSGSRADEVAGTPPGNDHCQLMGVPPVVRSVKSTQLVLQSRIVLVAEKSATSCAWAFCSVIHARMHRSFFIRIFKTSNITNILGTPKPTDPRIPPGF